MSIIAREHVHNDGNNQIRVKGLFKETVNQVKEDQKGHDVLTCVAPEHVLDEDTGKVRWYSLERLFMDFVPDDPTEYSFAHTVFGSMKAWEWIQRHPMVQPKLQTWRAEVEKQLRAKGVQYMIQEVGSGGKDSFRAAKFLIEKGWLEGNSPQVGRPKKKADPEQVAKEDKELLGYLSEDADRLGLTLKNPS